MIMLIALLWLGGWAVQVEPQAVDAMTDVAGWQDGAALQAQFDEPSGLRVGDRQLYIADTNTYRVRVMHLQTREAKILLLRSLTPPAPPAPLAHPGDIASSESLERGEVIRLSEQSLPALTQTYLRIGLHAPAGWQVKPVRSQVQAVQTRLILHDRMATIAREFAD